MSHLASILFDTVAFLAPIAPVIVGGLATEYAGRLNIALEGLLLAGAFACAAVGSRLGLAAGFAAAIALSSALAYLADLFSRKTGADSFVVGLGVNMAVPAFASIASLTVFGTKGVAVVEAVLSPRPLGEAAGRLAPLLGHRLSDYLALAIAALLAFILAKTPFGLRARAAGMSEDSLAMAGLDAGRMRGYAALLSGLACGAGGAALAASIGAYVPNMSSGRGWIALVAIYLGAKRLGGALAAGALFALLLSFAARAQSFLAVPAELLMAAPYFITALGMALGSRKRLRPLGR